MTTVRSGRCLCGAVRFEANVPQESFSMCHCGMCRRWTAGLFMTVQAVGPLQLVAGADTVSWHRSSAWAERGFCSRCGSSLFWRLAEDPDRFTQISVEALDDVSGFTLHRHTHVDAQPARYAFADDRPRVTEAELLAELGISLPPAT